MCPANGRHSQIARFIGPTWGPPGSCWPQMGPMLAPRTLLSGLLQCNFISHWPGTYTKWSLRHDINYTGWKDCCFYVYDINMSCPWLKMITCTIYTIYYACYFVVNPCESWWSIYPYYSRFLHLIRNSPENIKIAYIMSSNGRELNSGSFLWNDTEHLWWWFSIGSDNGLVLLSKKPSPDPLLSHFYVDH